MNRFSGLFAERPLRQRLVVGCTTLGLLAFLCLTASVWLTLEPLRSLWSPQAEQITSLPPPSRAAIPPLRPTPTLLIRTPLSMPPETPQPTLTPTLLPAGPLPPDGGADEPFGQIVFTCFIDGVDDICRMDTEGANVRRLTQAPATDFYPEWGPLGQDIIFSSRRTGEFQLFLMQSDGTNLRQVSRDFGSLFAPDISPDGERVLFTNAFAGRQNIWIMNVDGTEAAPLTTGAFNDVDPVWSPDGSQIAFASDRAGFPAHYLMDPNGENMRLLPDDAPNNGGRSSWSPDGRWLATYAGPRNSRDVYLIATDGSGATVRLTEGGRNLAPDFSPDGRWLAFTSYRAGDDAEIFIMRVDGSDVRQLTDNDWADWQPRWSTLAP